MEGTEWKCLGGGLLKKYRWAAVVVLVGLFLMALPQGRETAEPVPQESGEMVSQDDLQLQLERILSRLEGAGKVQVLLSMASGPETHYQTDVDLSNTGEKSDKRSETVIITDPDRDQQGLKRRVDPPVYQGAVVLCQGADSPTVRLAVVDAVGTATGLTSDRISVLKMK